MKHLPCACNKQRIYDFFNELSYSLVSNEIWNAIMKERGLTLEQAKREKKLLKSEAKAVMVALGELVE